MRKVEIDQGGAPTDDRVTITGLGGVRDLLTAPGLVGFAVSQDGLQHSSSAKVGKQPPPPPAPSRF